MVSIVVSWRDRVELERTLASLEAAAAAVDGEVLIVDFGGQEALFARQLCEAGPRTRAVRVPDQPYFSKAAAQNVGARWARCDTLFFCDGDVLLDPAHVAALCARVTGPRFGNFEGVRESDPARHHGVHGRHVTRFGVTVEIETRDGRSVRLVDREASALDGTRDAPGLLMVQRRHFVEVNGFDARLRGWGWVDQDMIVRLVLGAGLERVRHGEAVHLSHDDAGRVGAYPTGDRWESRYRLLREALERYDRGELAGTYAADVAALPQERVR